MDSIKLIADTLLHVRSSKWYLCAHCINCCRKWARKFARPVLSFRYPELCWKLL